MNRFAWTLATLAILASPGRGDDKEADKTKADLDKFQGTWTIVGLEQGGKKLPVEAIRDQTVTFEKDKYTLKVLGQVQEQGTQSLDPSKTPKAIDVKIERGPDKGKDQVGIYQIDGDDLKLCFAQPGAKERPTEFKTTADSNTLLFTFKREKPP